MIIGHTLPLVLTVMVTTWLLITGKTYIKSLLSFLLTIQLFNFFFFKRI
jgi:hypothetical protein